MYGIPQEIILDNNKLKGIMEKYGYYEVPHTPGLWKHYRRKTKFKIVAYGFGIKYQNTDNDNHIIQDLHKYYQVEVDFTGGLY